MAKRKQAPYPQGKRHYVFGEPPLGIMYLSAVLKRQGHEVHLTDQSHPEYSDDKYVESLKDIKPHIVGISFLSNMCYPAAKGLSRKIKAVLPSVSIVYGGVFATINAEKIIAHEDSVDIVAIGEGEGIIQDLVGGLDKLKDIPGITFRSNQGKIIKTPDREQISDLDSIPFPDREGLDINYVASLPLDVPAVIWDRPYTTIVSSRGCPFGCIYCNCPTFSGRKVRTRSAENVLKELEEINKLNYGSFTFLDDNFLLNIDRVKDICRGMLSQSFAFKWACEGRVDYKGEDLFKNLSAAGCDLVMFGIESGSQRVLNSMNKRTRIADIENAVSQAKEAGISIIHGFFIVGSQGETVEEVKESFAFAEKLKINSFNFNSLTAFRGTPLWNSAATRNLINEEKDWDKMFPVHEIFPDTIDSKTLFLLRSHLVKRLIKRKLIHHPGEAIKIMRRFMECMSVKDIYLLLTSSKDDHTRKRN